MHKSLVKAASTGTVLAASIIFFSTISVRAAVEQARKADDFVESLGVVVHVSRNNCALTNPDSPPNNQPAGCDPQGPSNMWPGVRDALCGLGVRTVRTTITAGRWVERVVDLYETCRDDYNSPITYNFRLDTTALGPYSKKRLCLKENGTFEQKCKGMSDMLAWAMAVGKEVGYEAINSWEGPNEYDSTKNLRCDPEKDVDPDTGEFADIACRKWKNAIVDNKRCNAEYWPTELLAYMNIMYDYIVGNRNGDILKTYKIGGKDVEITEDDIENIKYKNIVAPSMYLGQDFPERYAAMTNLQYMENNKCKSKYISDYIVANIGDVIDRGNLHTYNAGRNPIAGNPDIPGDGLDQRVANAKGMTLYEDDSGDDQYRRIYVTEYGYRTHGKTHVTETAKAKYLPRYAAEFFIRDDVDKIINYQIVDEQPSENKPDSAWGLLGNDDNTLFKRPSYHAMRNTIALLKDPGADFEPANLDYDVSGDPEQKVRWFLAQKRNGLYYLVLWQRARSAEPGGVAGVNECPEGVTQCSFDLDVPPVPVTLAFNTPVSSVKSYRPTALHVPLDPDKGIDPICVDDTDPACDRGFYAEPSEIELPVPDEVVVLEIDATGSITASNVGNNADFAWTDLAGESGSETIDGIKGNTSIDGMKMTIEAINGTIRATGQNGFAVTGSDDIDEEKKNIEGDEAVRFSLDSSVDAVLWRVVTRIRTEDDGVEEVIATAYLDGAEVDSKSIVVDDGPFSGEILLDFGGAFDTLVFSAGDTSRYSIADQTMFVTVNQ